MALFGSSKACVGLDIGTSSLKLVELLDRRRRIEVATYAQAALPNLLLRPVGDEQDAVRAVASVVTRMIEKAGVVTDNVVAALPSSAVFTTVLPLPALAEAEMDKAVQFAARDAVPANLDEMVLGWSRLGETPHMQGEKTALLPAVTATGSVASKGAQPVFLTAAPIELVRRYTQLVELLRLDLVALEVETFPLVRSLLGNGAASVLIADIGDTVTTFHMIEGGAARASRTIEYGGQHLTEAIAATMAISQAAAEEKKVQFGLAAPAPDMVKAAVETAVRELVRHAKQLLELYERTGTKRISKSVLIGGGANLKGLADYWAKALGHSTVVGNPWRGLSYPRQLEAHLRELGPTYAVAVGLAQRGIGGL